MPCCVAGPHLGAQFAQLVKELRSEYAAAVTACAERIAGALFQRPGYSINASLHRHGVTGTPTIMQQQVSHALPLSPGLEHHHIACNTLAIRNHSA